MIKSLTKKYAIDKDIIERALVVYDEEEYKNFDIGTKVIFPVNKKGEVYGFMIYGSTGYAPKPYDIVSSCIATISFFTLNTIRMHTNDMTKYMQVEDEHLQVFMLPSLKNGKGSKISKVILKSMVTEMLNIQDQYSKHLKVFIKWD